MPAATRIMKLFRNNCRPIKRVRVLKNYMSNNQQNLFYLIVSASLISSERQ